MGRTLKDALDTAAMFDRLARAGIEPHHREELRRISMTLHAWHELECGSDRGAIEREETKPGEPPGKVWWISAATGKRCHRVPDRETGALVRLAEIMSHYPALSYYVQGDPRGCSLYILRPGDVPAGEPIDSYYSRGIAVFK